MGREQRHPLLGLAPIGKFVFSHEDAVRQKQALQQLLTQQGIAFVDLDSVLPDGMVRSAQQVDQVVAYLQGQEIDGLFLPHCNFGTESAVGMIAKRLHVPTLLWGPRDEQPLPNGERLRDTLCGMLASSGVLRKMGVPFSYIENCRMTDAPLREGLDRFLRVSNVLRGFRQGLRIGHIGQRIDFFWSTIVNEGELLERFHIEVLPIDMVTFIRDLRARAQAQRAQYQQEAEQLRREMDIIGLEDEQLRHILAARDQMRSLVADHGLDGLAIQDFQSLVDEIGAYCFLANSMVSDEIPLSCESDLHGAVSVILLHRAGLQRDPVFLADITARHPEDDNGVLLWHAGAPLALRQPEAPVRVGHHWILPSPVSGMPHFPLRHGPITLMRFDADHGHYQLVVGEGDAMPGPYTQNNYVWMRVDDWPHWERTLMNGPFIHHAAMCYQHLAPVVRDLAPYLPELQIVSLNKATR